MEALSAILNIICIKVNLWTFLKIFIRKNINNTIIKKVITIEYE